LFQMLIVVLVSSEGGDTHHECCSPLARIVVAPADLGPGMFWYRRRAERESRSGLFGDTVVDRYLEISVPFVRIWACCAALG